MEMTLRRLGFNYIGPVLKNMGLPLGILMLVAMMVLPLPAVLLDIFFTSNILLSLLILMVAMNAFRPLDFSSFPTILSLQHELYLVKVILALMQQEKL